MPEFDTLMPGTAATLDRAVKERWPIEKLVKKNGASCYFSMVFSARAWNRGTVQVLTQFPSVANWVNTCTVPLFRSDRPVPDEGATA